MPTISTTFHPRPTKTQRTYVDFVFALDYLSINSALPRIMQGAMADYGLSSLLVNQSSVDQAIDAVRNGRLKPLLYLDLCAKPGGPFFALLEAMNRAGVHTLSDLSGVTYTN